MGTLRNYDGDGNGNDGSRFSKQNKNSARASPFFVDIFAVPCTWPDQILSLLDRRIGN